MTAARRQWSYTIVGFLMMIFMTALATAYYYWFFEKPWLTYENLPFPLVERGRVYTRGEVIPLLVRRCNRSGKIQNYKISHSFENLATHELTIMRDIDVPAVPGCNTGISLVNKVPEEVGVAVAPGLYRVVGVAVIKGTLRDFQVEWYSVPFQIDDSIVPGGVSR